MAASTVRSSSVYQLLTQFLLLVLSILTAPYYFAKLGEESYGLLVLIGLTSGYLAFLELGLGQAAVKLIAESLESSDGARGSAVIGTAGLSSLVLGVVGASVLAACSSLLPKVFSVAEDSAELARRAFVIGAISLSVSMQASIAAAPLRALERFDIVSRVTLWTALAQGLAGVLALETGYGLEALLLTVVAIQVPAVFVSWGISAHIYPPIRSPTWDWSAWRSLLRFGGHVTLSQVTAPLLVNSEKFLIGTLLGASRLPYYSIPFGLVWSLTAVPASLGTVIFARFAHMTAAGEQDASRVLAARVSRFTFAALLPITVVAAVYAKEILDAWMGPDFGTQGAASLRILALAMLVNVAAWPTYQLLQASGHPEVPARFHLIELGLHIPASLVLISRFGITGAALAWLLRVLLDTLALAWAGHHYLGMNLMRDTIRAVGRPIAFGLALISPALLPKALLHDLGRAESIVLLGLTAATYTAAAFALGLAPSERSLVLDSARVLMPRLGRRSD